MKRWSIWLLRAAIPAIAMVPIVAARAAAHGTRYTVSTGTVYDSKTTRTWQQTIAPVMLAQTAAATYCSGLTLNGAAGWRLPTMKELVTIEDFSATAPPAIDPVAFPATPAGYFWTSTPCTTPAAGACYVDFRTGASSCSAPSGAYWVRCVR